MAKIKILSAREVTTKPNGYHADGGNLFLRVRDDSRVWIFRYKKEGKQISIGLGSIHARSMTEARALAESMRNAIINKQDPAQVLKAQDEPKVMIFKECALAMIEAKRPTWRNNKHAVQWLNTF